MLGRDPEDWHLALEDFPDFDIFCALVEERSNFCEDLKLDLEVEAASVDFVDVDDLPNRVHFFGRHVRGELMI